MAVYQFTSASKFSDNETVTIAQVSPETTGTLFQMVLNGPPARTIDLENPSEEVATLESGDKLIINSVDGLDDTYVFAISKMPQKCCLVWAIKELTPHRNVW